MAFNQTTPTRSVITRQIILTEKYSDQKLFNPEAKAMHAKLSNALKGDGT